MEDVAAVLTQRRGGPLQRRRRIRQDDSGTEDEFGAEAGAGEDAKEVSGGQLRIAQQVPTIEHRRGRDSGVLEFGGGLPVGTRIGPGGDAFIEFRLMQFPARGGAETVIGHQRLKPLGSGQPRPHLVISDRDRHPSVLATRRIDTVRSPPYVAVAVMGGTGCPQSELYDRRGDAGQRHVVLRQLDVTTLSGLVAALQRGEDAHGAGLGRYVVGVRKPDLNRVAIRPPDHPVDARNGREVLAPRPIRPVRPGVAERGQADVDDVALDGPNGFVADLQPGQHIGAEVGDEHIRSGHQLGQDGVPVGTVDFEADAALAGGGKVLRRHRVLTDVGVVVGRHPSGRAGPQRVGAATRLDPDHVGAEFGHVTGGHRRGDPGAELDYADARQRRFRDGINDGGRRTKWWPEASSLRSPPRG